MSHPTFDRRTLLGASVTTLIAAAAGGNSPLRAENSTKPPTSPFTGSGKSQCNIVLFLADEMRADTLACYGNPGTRTPNFDLLASQGVLFENCHVQFPVCGASRCSLLTGWPASVRGHRSLGYFLRPDEPNLFRYLRNAGYDVYWFGKNDALSQQSFPSSVTEWSERGRYVPASSGGAAPQAGKPYSFLYPAEGDRRDSRDYALLQAAIAVLARKETDRPFCILLAMDQPHPPYTVPPEFYNMYSPAQLPPLAPPGRADKPNFHAGIRDYYGLEALTDKDFRKIRAVYHGQVSYSDWLFGELLEALARTNREKDTALFALSDHGDYAGDFGLVEKWASGLEDALTHVPLIARVPGGQAGVRSREIVELFDLMQTCLELGGAAAQHTHFSRSLLPQIAGMPGDPERAAFAEGGFNVYEPQCFDPLDESSRPVYRAKLRLAIENPAMVSRAAMVRTRDHKLIVRPNGRSELYDCRSDPQQLENLYDHKVAGKIMEPLQRRLVNWYINTTGIAPFDKDARGTPPFSRAPEFSAREWHPELLDH